MSGRWFRGDEETRPTIGDWVIVDSQSGALLDMLARRSLIKRVNPLGALQLIAANVDTAFIVTSCKRGLQSGAIGTLFVGGDGIEYCTSLGADQGGFGG